MTAPTKAPDTARDFALKAQSAGYQAAMKGKGISENPYMTEERRADWLVGFAQYLKRLKEVKK